MGYIISDNNQEVGTPTATITPTTNTYPIPAGLYVEAIVMYPVNADVISVGTTPGGIQFENDFTLTPNDNNTVIIQRKFKINTTIYFTGITGNTLITIYQR